MRPKNILFLFLFLASASLAPAANAGKLDAYFGVFDFAAKTPIAKGSKSGLGAYKISVLLPISTHWEAGIGYSLIYADTFTGDSVYGFDLEAAYFPFTPARRVKVQSAATSLSMDTLWRPFAMVGFNARQFQSIATQYNGYSLGLGVERVYDARFTFKGLFRYAGLTGPTGSSATEMTVVGGISFNF